MKASFDYVVRLGDNALILGQRLSEWCGHSPFLEEDVAMANIALDHIGRARMLLNYAAEIEGQGRDEDALAFHRDERDFHNFLICELPVGDYAFTMLRQYLLDVYHLQLFEALTGSSDEQLAAIAAKSVKESRYHVRRSADWVCRFGDGTDESHQRAQRALDELWGYTPELFADDDVDRAMHDAGVAPAGDELGRRWQSEVGALLARATLTPPSDEWAASGGRDGLHTEHMGRLLAEMQAVQRANPGLTW